MSNTLIVGKDLPDSLDFAQIFSKSGRKVFVSGKQDLESEKFETENIFTANWNRDSGISARSLLIKAESKLQKIDEVVLYFDSLYFASKFDADKTENVTPAIEQMITGFQFFINELILRMGQRNEKIIISFLVRSVPSRYEMNFTNTYKTLNVFPASNIVISAEKAFMALAENTAALIGDEASVFLGQCTATNDYYKNEQEIARWMISAFDVLSNPKTKYGAKQAVVWNKAGSKFSTGFSLFK